MRNAQARLPHDATIIHTLKHFHNIIFLMTNQVMIQTDVFFCRVSPQSTAGQQCIRPITLPSWYIWYKKGLFILYSVCHMSLTSDPFKSLYDIYTRVNHCYNMGASPWQYLRCVHYWGMTNMDEKMVVYVWPLPLLNLIQDFCYGV